jgi:hypothetical protein
MMTSIRKDYEERIYPPQTWVRTSMRNNSREDCTYPMFWKLFNYISGQNGRQLKIPMTAPVSVLVQPDDDQCGGAAAGDLQTTFTMAFYIPAPFDQDPPEPNESSVTIEYRPELRIFVRFGLNNLLYRFAPSILFVFPIFSFYLFEGLMGVSRTTA